MSKTEADQLLRAYLEAKAEFERIAHSETINSDEYEAARGRAKAALKRYRAGPIIGFTVGATVGATGRVMVENG